MLKDRYGNPLSTHSRAARNLADRARALKQEKTAA